MNPDTRDSLLTDMAYALRQLRRFRALERALNALQRVEWTLRNLDQVEETRAALLAESQVGAPDARLSADETIDAGLLDAPPFVEQPEDWEGENEEAS